MADEVINTVKSSSDGAVTITVERYQELLDKAAEKAPIIYRTVHKTAAIAAADNRAWGAVLMGFGTSFLVIGGIMYAVGRHQAANL